MQKTMTSCADELETFFKDFKTPDDDKLSKVYTALRTVKNMLSTGGKGAEDKAKGKFFGATKTLSQLIGQLKEAGDSDDQKKLLEGCRSCLLALKKTAPKKKSK